MLHSPTPWRIVRSALPYYTWIMSADGGVVCLGFGQVDEALLLAAPTFLTAVEAALVALDTGRIGDARSILAHALEGDNDG